MPTHSQATGSELHEDKRVKRPVRVASTANVDTASPGATIDSVSLVAGDRILLKNQAVPATNGIYTWSGAAVALARAADCLVASDFEMGFLVYVREGTTQTQTYWVYSTTTTPVVVGSTSITFKAFDAGGGTVSSVALTVPASLSVTGSPITNTGTLALSHTSQTPNTIASGPASGGSAAWAFRAMVAADMPLFGASGGTHAAGAVPDPGGTAGTTKFLREDRTWQVPAGSGGGVVVGGSGGSGSGALVPLMSIGPITATQSTLSFSGIPTTGFRNLYVKLSGRGTITAGTLLNAVDVGIRANNDSATNYDWTESAFYQGGELDDGTQADNAAYVTKIPASGGAPSGLAGAAEIFIADYASTTFEKSFQSDGALKLGTSASQQYSTTGSGHWRNTAAITDLALNCQTGNFDIGTYACLYGEMDTQGVLLAPASNLLFERTLTAASATIDTGTLSQAYRDLRITYQARGDTAANDTGIRMRFNGDTASNYQYENHFGFGSSTSASTSGGAQTSALVGQMTAASSAANLNSSGFIVVPNYTGTTYFREFLARGFLTSNILQTEEHDGWWASTVAVTSIQLFPAAGNFAAGTVVRVYGEPVSAGGGSYGTGTRLRIAGNQSLTDATDSLVLWDTEDSDADQQHYTSAAALSPATSCAKTAGSQTLTGTSTTFLTDLSVGQVISVPGTAAEKRVVIAIASNTSLTVNAPFANSASSQTVTRVNSAIVFRQPGFYELKAGAYFASSATGFRKVALILNDTTVIGQSDVPSIGAVAMGVEASAGQQFAQWDFVEVLVRQNSGGSLNLTADQRTFFSSTSRPTVYIQGPEFGASGTFHATGWVPDPGAVAGATKFLREDKTWSVPAGTGGSSGSSSAGGSGALVPIQVVGPLSATQAAIDFSVPATGYKNLKIVWNARAVAASGNEALRIQFNGDTASNYDTILDDSGGTVATTDVFGNGGYLANASHTTGFSSSGQIFIPDYASTTFHKNAVSLTREQSLNRTGRSSFTWKSLAAITSIKLSPQTSTAGFVAGSYFCLYGEMDTAGVLLTPASNLLYETTLAAAAASIDTGTLNQAYRDLQIEVSLRGDDSARQNLLVRFNGDTGANYNSGVWGTSSATQTNQTAANSMAVNFVPGTAQSTGFFSTGTIILPGYTSTVSHKAAHGVFGDAGGNIPEMGYALWHPSTPTAVTSIQMLPAAGNFIAGSTVRVYGLPQSNGGSSVGTGTRTRIAGNLSVTDVTDTIVSWDTNDSDADSQHYTSAAALTPATSVTKVAGSQTLTGSGTAFLTELSVGQVISVPGTAAEKRVVTAIASNSSLTVNAPFVNSASAQTATRLNSAIVFRSPGFYEVKAAAYWASSAAGNRKVAIVLNDATVIGQDDRVNIGATAMGHLASAAQSFQQWDFVEVQVRQSSGGALNLTADQRTFFSALSRPTVLIATPVTRVELAATPSNLLYETVLTAAQATIDTGTLSQSYKDLEVVAEMRGDTAATSTNLLIRFNGDTTATYDYMNRIFNATGAVAATAAQPVRMVAASAPATVASAIRLQIPNYSITTNQKGGWASDTIKLANSTGQMGDEEGSFFWRSTAAINSIQIAPLAGNFAAGTVFRVYGLPVSNGITSAGTGTRVRMGSNWPISNNADGAVGWDTEDSDADSQHTISSANLSGTVTKTTSSQTLAGSGTAFLTELTVGQAIVVPGTAVEKRVVTAIASNTSLTVNTSFANTSSGQVASYLNTAIVFRTAGFYDVSAGVYWASNATGQRGLMLKLNDTTYIAQDNRLSIGAVAMGQTVTTHRAFAEWDFIEAWAYQDSGGALNVTADQRSFLAATARPTVYLTTPYVNIQDQKTAGVDGGTFNAGAWRTRDLNTKQSDRNNLATVAANQIILPAGTYRTHIVCPGTAIGRHLARLQNITAGATLIIGQNAPTVSGATGSYGTVSIITGSFTLAVSSTLEVQHQCTVTKTTDGFGYGSVGFTVPPPFDVYTIAEFWKEG